MMVVVFPGEVVWVLYVVTEKRGQLYWVPAPPAPPAPSGTSERTAGGELWSSSSSCSCSIAENICHIVDIYRYWYYDILCTMCSVLYCTISVQLALLALWSPQTGFYHQYFLCRPVVETEQYKPGGTGNQQTALCLCIYLSQFFTASNSRAKKCLEFSISSIPGGRDYCGGAQLNYQAACQL